MASGICLVAAWVGPCVTASADPASEAYAQASHGGHHMSAEVMDELRAKVPSYKGKPDQYLHESMIRMGPDYEWYLSDDALTGNIGVLVLSHSAGVEGDRRLVRAVGPIAAKFPTAIAFGMAMMSSDAIRAAADHLATAGADEIVVIPIVVTEHNSLAKQWEYIFGKRDEAPYASVARVTGKSRIRMSPPMAAHPLVTEILSDHIRAVSVDAADEVIVIVGHGPSDSAENQAELAILQRHVNAIRKSGGYSDVVAINLQDDAPDEVRAANVKRLREIVESVEVMGKQTIVVPFLMMTGRVRNKLNNDLAGLDFKFNSAGLSAHPKFAQWIAEAVQPGASSSD